MKQLSFFFLLLIFAFLITSSLHAQVGINTTGTPADASAMLDVTSTNKGVLIPRITTTQRNAIANPALGLLVYDSTEQTIFMYDGKQWLGFAPLTSNQRPANNYQYGPDISDTTLAGYSVSMWDQYAAIGIPYHKTGGYYTGGVYIYKLNGTHWDYQTTLLPGGNDINSNFGVSVSLKGNYLAVGAPGQQNIFNVSVGAAYVFYFNGTSWASIQTIFGTSANSGFGNVVSINQFGNYVAVSEPNVNSNTGTVRIYFKSGGVFSLQASLQDPSPVTFESFGSAMAMSPNGFYVIVGAPGKTVGGHSGNGYVGEFKRSGTSWAQQNTVTLISEDNLAVGERVDISDNYAIFTIGKTGQMDYLTNLNGGWSGGTVNFGTEHINSITLDPTTDIPYAVVGNSVYTGYNYTASKIKGFSIEQEFQSATQLLAVYNKEYVIGFPTGVIPDRVYVGAFYFGTSPQ